MAVSNQARTMFGPTDLLLFAVRVFVGMALSLFHYDASASAAPDERLLRAVGVVIFVR